ncbi:hypothetical protein HPB47_024643 [Ixodes persulcatus]|uniref:Uncharacterized protein n=1 Tax=Ixodes persulcatus TaxID=34615 RepID=A0AC60Q6G7_IXOPE|nr:hypothetical protein HPB47_024643 [Ixodes persulcatus]
MAGRDSLLKSDDEEELVFDQTGLLTNKLSSRHSVFTRTLVVNSGGRLTIARTVNLCLSFFGLGLCFAIPTATIQDLQRRTNSEASIEHIYTARYGGYIFGCLIGGFLFDWYNRQFLLFLSIFATSIGIVVMPFCAQLSTLMACSAITGITMGFLDTGGNVWCLDLWGRHSAPFMQGLHFCFALGALVAPLVAEPFLSPSGPVGTPQHVQPLHPGNLSLPVDNFGHIPSIGIHHGIAVNRPLPHTLISGATPGFLEHDRPRRRRRGAKQTTSLPQSSEPNNAIERGADVGLQPRMKQLPLNTVPKAEPTAVGARAETECGGNGKFQHLCKRYREWKRVDDSLERHLLVIYSFVNSGPEFKLRLFVGSSFVDGDTNFELSLVVATTTTKRSSETLAPTKPDIPRAHHEVQTAPSTSGRKPSVATTITAATVAITTLPPLETAVVTPSNHPETASNDVPSNATEADGSAPDPDGPLQKASETSPTEPPGLTSWLLDKFKQNRLGKLEFVYAILGAYLFVVSAVFLAFLCTNPRETRSRQEEDAKVQGPSSKWSLVVLTSLFFFLYMGMEAAVGELLRIYAAPQTPGAPLPRGYLLTYVFWGSFAAARGVAVVAAIKVSCRTMLLGDLGVCFLASVLLVVGADRMDALLWAGVGVLGVGMASVLPTSLAWLERHVRVTNRVASFVLLGAAAGEMVLPFLASRLVDREPAVVVYVNVTVVTLCCLNFGALWLAAAKRGEKYAAAELDRSMYQLANLDDADESADFTLMRPLCANGDDGHALLMAGKPRARFLRDPDMTTS